MKCLAAHLVQLIPCCFVQLIPWGFFNCEWKHFKLFFLLGHLKCFIWLTCDWKWSIMFNVPTLFTPLYLKFPVEFLQIEKHWIIAFLELLWDQKSKKYLRPCTLLATSCHWALPWTSYFHFLFCLLAFCFLVCFIL